MHFRDKLGNSFISPLQGEVAASISEQTEGLVPLHEAAKAVFLSIIIAKKSKSILTLFLQKVWRCLIFY